MPRRNSGHWLIILLLLLSGMVTAHPAPFSYLDLRLRADGIEATLTVHLLDLAHETGVAEARSLLDTAVLDAQRAAILGIINGRLSLAVDGQPIAAELLAIEPVPDRDAVALRLRYPLTSVPGRVTIDCRLFPYDPQHQTFINLYDGENLAWQGIFTADNSRSDYFTGTRQGAMAVVRRFLPSGIEHIFRGPDHILFLVGLLLLGGSLSRLLLIVTAFTLAHSVTLSLAALDLLQLPADLVEPAIALSIVYVGIDNLLAGKSGRDLRAWTAFFFGLIHGFGFASVLREFGLPTQALGWSLFSFNLGVEIGQAAIVIIVAGLLTWLRRRWPALDRHLILVGSVVIIACGGWWFIERIRA